MAKASVIAARQAQAAENMAGMLAEIIERLERVERKLDKLGASFIMIELARLAADEAEAEPSTETVVEMMATETQPAPAVETEPETGAEAAPPATETQPAKQPASKEKKAK